MRKELRTYCLSCAASALGSWKGWPHKNAVPVLPALSVGSTCACGCISTVCSDAIHWLNCHGRYNTGLPDYWLLVVGSEPNTWGTPYFSEKDCPTCGRRAVVSVMGAPNGITELKLNCASCGLRPCAA